MEKLSGTVSTAEIFSAETTKEINFMSHSSLIRELVCMIPPSHGTDCVLVAIDGPSGAGKTTLTAALASRLLATGRAVVPISVDNFLRKRALRHQGGMQASGLYRRDYQYLAFEHCVMAPLPSSGSRCYCPAIYDRLTDTTVESKWLVAPEGAVVIVEGLFLLRDHLTHEWDLSIFLDVEEETWISRVKNRDHCPHESFEKRMIPSINSYNAECHPKDRATVTVKYDDFEQPRLITRCPSAEGSHAT